MGTASACLLTDHCHCHLEGFSKVTDICCREGFFTVLLTLRLCAVSPLILQARSDIVLVSYLNQASVFLFAEMILMLDTWVTAWHETVGVVALQSSPFSYPA